MRTFRIPIIPYLVAGSTLTLIVICVFAGLGLGDLTIKLPAQAPHGTASEEVPRGVIDGINTTFTLNFQPAPWGSIHVYRNGVRQMRHTDYELGGPNHTQIIFTPIPIVPPGTGILGVPQPGDILLADYTY